MIGGTRNYYNQYHKECHYDYRWHIKWFGKDPPIYFKSLRLKIVRKDAYNCKLKEVYNELYTPFNHSDFYLKKNPNSFTFISLKHLLSYSSF